MLEVFGTLYLTEGVSEQLAIDRAQRIFSCLDTNNDGEITEEEFVTGCLQVKLTPPPNVTFFNYTLHLVFTLFYKRGSGTLFLLRIVCLKTFTIFVFFPWLEFNTAVNQQSNVCVNV